MGTAHVQLLVVADDRPVDADIAAENAVLHIGAELAQQVQALTHPGRVTGPLQIDISAVTIGRLLHRGHRVLAADVDDHLSTTLPGQLQLGLGQVKANHKPRILRLGPRDYPQPDRTATSHNHHVVEPDLSPLHRMQRAGQRFSKRGVSRRKNLRNLVHQRVLGINHVPRHSLRGAPLKAEHVMRTAHVILAVQAVPALPAGHDLLRDDMIADRDPPTLGCLAVELNNGSGEYRAGDDLSLRPRRPVLILPELRRPVIALQVTDANPYSLDLDQGFTGPREGNSHFLQLIVPWTVTDDSLYLVRYPAGLLSAGLGHPRS